MKIFATIVVAAAVLAQPAFAISRYQSTRLTCDQAQGRVEEEGAVILRWSSQRKPGLPLYNRYVANGTFCQVGEATYVEYVPTRDTPQCPVLACKQIFYDWD